MARTRSSRPKPSLTRPSPLTGGKAAFAYFLIAISLVGFHLRLSISTESGTTLVPQYLILIPAAVLAVAQANELSRRAGGILITLMVFVVLQTTLTFAPGENTLSLLLSGAQLLASISACATIVYTCSRLSAHGLRRLFFGYWVTLMGLAALETFGLRTALSSVTAAIYAHTSRGVYSADVRDTLIYGRPRPTALASEPSFLAISWIAMAALVFLLDKERGSARSWFRFLAMVIVGYLLAPSNLILFFLLATVLWHFWPRGSTSSARLLARFVFGGAAFLALIPLLSAAVARIESAETASFFARVTSGPVVGYEALLNFPILGYGIGNSDGVAPIVSQVWNVSGSFARWPWYVGVPAETLMANGFWWQWISLGVVGGTIFTLLILRLLRSLSVQTPLRVVVCAWIVWYSGGIFVSPVDWLIVAFFAIPALWPDRARATPQERSTRSTGIRDRSEDRFFNEIAPRGALQRRRYDASA